MNKSSKTILIISIAVFACFLIISIAQAIEVMPLLVEFEDTPLFNEANFLPGESITRWVKVTNNSGETQKIGVNVTGHSDCLGSYCLSDELNLVISKNGTPLYTGSLTDFYDAGEIYLSDLNDGDAVQYDFTVTFLPGTGNDYQGLSTDFDFEIGFFGSETVSEQIPPAPGGGGGGIFVGGLIIFNQTFSGVKPDSVILNWQTNLFATSRVIYDTVSHPVLGNPPNYGYAFSTDEDSNKVTFHSVTITGLIPGTTYYWRGVSHTSPDEILSDEMVFTTEIPSPEIPPTETPSEAPPVIPPPTHQASPNPLGGSTGGKKTPGGEETAIEQPTEGEKIAIGRKEETKKPEEKQTGTDFDKFLAAVGRFFTFKNLCWILFSGIVILMILFLLSKKRREKKEPEI